MTDAVRVRWRAGVLLLSLGASCARTGLYDYASLGSDPDGTGASAADGTGAGTGGRGSSGGTSVGGSTDGGRFGGGTGADGARGGTSATSGRGGDSGSTGTGGITSTRICPALVRDNLDRAALGYLSRDELLLHRPSGATIRVNAAASGNSRLWREDQFLVLVHQAEEGFTVSLVDRDGNVQWSHERLAEDVDSSRMWVSPHGDAAILLTGAEQPGIAILADGGTFRLPAYPMAAPTELGWVPIQDDARFGFVNVLTGEILRARLRLDGPSFYPTLTNGKLVYLARSPDAAGIAVLGLASEQFFPIPGLDLRAAMILPTAVGAVVLEHRVPRAVFDGTLVAVHEVGPLARDPAFEFDTQFLVGETWGMVVEGSVARYRIGLRDGSATRLEPAIGAPQHALAQVLMNDGWAFGTTTGGSLLFYVDVESARVAPVDLSALAPFRRLDESNCAALPVLLDDGRLALALRDSATARMFLGRPSQSPWTRLGRPVSEVVSFAASHRSGAWILAGNSGNDTFCNGRIGAGSVIPEEALLGDSVQVVLHDQPEREIAFEGYALSEFVFHDSGLCAFARGTIYDFPSGERTALPFDASQVTFF